MLDIAKTYWHLVVDGSEDNKATGKKSESQKENLNLKIIKLLRSKPTSE